MSIPTEPNVQTIENATREAGRPGDHMEWEEIRTRGGITRTTRREGIAHHRDASGNWCTKDGQWITIGESGGVTLTIRRPVKNLPTTPGTTIVANDGQDNIEAVFSGIVSRTREAALVGEGDWYAAWRYDSRVMPSITREEITPGTWKVEEK